MDGTQVFYNGTCPVCSAEVGRYRRMVPGAAPVCWNDVQVSPSVLADHGLTVDDVVRRIHVLTRDGRMVVGIRALAVIWNDLPSPFYRAMANVVRWPVARTMANVAYEILATVLYAWNTRRQRHADLGTGQ